MDFPMSLAASSAFHEPHRRAASAPRAPAVITDIRKTQSYASLLKGMVEHGLEDMLVGRGRARSRDPLARHRELSVDSEFTEPEDEEQKEIAACKERIRDAKTAQEFTKASAELDALRGVEEWKSDDNTDLYDHHLVEAKIQEYEEVLQRGSIDEMLETLRRSIGKNFAGLSNPELYTHTQVGTKHTIERYINTVRDLVEAIAKHTELNDAKRNDKVLRTLKSIRRQSGRTALLLSGGGALGMNHIGVVKGLCDAGLLPRIVSGSSAGSVVASITCTRTDPEVRRVMRIFQSSELPVFVGEGEDSGGMARVKNFLAHRPLYDVCNLARFTETWFGDMTFAESYPRSGRILNIPVSSTNGTRGPLLLNMYSAPHVLIRSAVVASCSVPLLFQAAKLLSKCPTTGKIEQYLEGETFVDGSLQGDIPMRDVSDQLGCDNFIVSQVNAHIRQLYGEAEQEEKVSLKKRFYSATTGMLWAEMSHQLGYLEAMVPKSKLMDDWHYLADQPYIGNITIFPTITRADLSKIFHNPTADFTSAATKNGERATWRKMNQIAYTTAIERIFHEAIRAIESRIAIDKKMAQIKLHIPAAKRFNLKQVSKIKLERRPTIEEQVAAVAVVAAMANLSRCKSAPEPPRQPAALQQEPKPAPKPQSRSKLAVPSNLRMTPMKPVSQAVVPAVNAISSNVRFSKEKNSLSAVMRTQEYTVAVQISPNAKTPVKQAPEHKLHVPRVPHSLRTRRRSKSRSRTPVSGTGTGAGAKTARVHF